MKVHICRALQLVWYTFQIGAHQCINAVLSCVLDLKSGVVDLHRGGQLLLSEMFWVDIK